MSLLRQLLDVDGKSMADVRVTWQRRGWLVVRFFSLPPCKIAILGFQEGIQFWSWKGKIYTGKLT